MLKGVGGWILGILVLLLMIGTWGVCQYGYGQARPYIPDPVRPLIDSEKEFEVDDYLNSVVRDFERFSEESGECRVDLDQVCQTKAVERLKDRIGNSVPASASWMSGAHGRLYAAIEEMADVNKLSETQQTDTLLRRGIEAANELDAAIEEWYEQAIR